MTEITQAADPWKTLAAAMERLQRAENAEPHADADAEAEYASELTALAARDLVRYIERSPERRPVGWDDGAAAAPVDEEFPATWAGGHALVIEFGDEEFLARCQCGEGLGYGAPSESLDKFQYPWERHVMTEVPR
jgi:hypothetical protein